MYIKELPSDDCISNKLLSLKLVALLDLTAASRASEICQLNIQYLAKNDSGYSFTLTKPTKCHKPGKTFPVIKYFKFPEDSKLCVCNTIDMYLKRTECWREGESQLLSSHIISHKKVTAGTII